VTNSRFHDGNDTGQPRYVLPYTLPPSPDAGLGINRDGVRLDDIGRTVAMGELDALPMRIGRGGTPMAVPSRT
jgi:hypothetical protein